MEIKVLESLCCGGGVSLKDSVDKVLKEIQIDASVIQISDFEEIARFGVISLPAIIINNKLVMKGSKPGYDEIEKLIRARF